MKKFQLDEDSLHKSVPEIRFYSALKALEWKLENSSKSQNRKLS